MGLLIPYSFISHLMMVTCLPSAGPTSVVPLAGSYCLTLCLGLNFRDWAYSASCSEFNLPLIPKFSRNISLLRSCLCPKFLLCSLWWSLLLTCPTANKLPRPLTSVSTLLDPLILSLDRGISGQARWSLPPRALWGSATCLCHKGEDGWLVLPSNFPRCTELPPLHFWFSGCNREADCHAKGEKEAQRPDSGRNPSSTSAWPKGLQEVAQALWCHSPWADSKAPGRLGPILQKS